MQEVPKAQLERAARIYKSNKDASQALGMALESFGRACRRYGTPLSVIGLRRGSWRC